MAPPTQYLFVDQGEGGIFKVPFTVGTTQTNYIGTHDCRTCVCVYVPLSPQDCFVAHIDAHADPNAPKDDDGHWIPSPADGAALRAFSLKLFAERLPKNLMKYSSRILKFSSVVICPMRIVHQDGTPRRATGSYVVEAINEFFKFGDGDAVTELAHGFAVDHQTSKKTYFMYNGAMEQDIIRDDKLRSLKRPNVADQMEMQYLEVLGSEKQAREYNYQDLESADKEGKWTFHLQDGRWFLPKAVQ